MYGIGRGTASRVVLVANDKESHGSPVRALMPTIARPGTERTGSPAVFHASNPPVRLAMSTEAGAPQQAGRDRTAIAALAVHDQQLLPIQFACPRLQLSQRDAHRVFDRAAAPLSRLAHVEHGDPARLLLP